ncbi:serine/threonine-protein phosphatase rdgC-like [Teleopsis dalmanni]|uniref:serine/threonine-protein phosphatase rdgC-like n=1 Tax=Teleopsis dalmanni TaxID=139649 RepID=UPI0018CDE0F6|nr:serine/threonine-protein phosphatase rdgC-like [Teleopsis dalmanni]
MANLIKATIKSALLIQAWYRRYKARLEMKKRCTWNIFQNLEYAKENDQIELFNFFVALLKHYQHGSPSIRSTSILTKSSLIDESEDQNVKLSEDPNYVGPQLKFPLIAKDVNNLIDLFRKKKNNQLDAKNVNRLLTEAISRLKRLPNINQASTVLSKQITIVGDLHGKLDDLLVILYKNGLPCAENPYVFNGDFVDRGKKSMEVFLLLIAFFLAFPGGVYLNRGNHEDSVMNGRYGFTKEVVLKYGNNAEALLKTIDEVYSWLPLGTIINNAIFVVHGGISDKTNLNTIKSLNREKWYRNIY